MAKAEWGTKRQCPKCGTRFYDLGKFDPVIICISCENKFKPEVILKSKHQAFEVEEKAKETPDDDIDLLDDDSLLEDEGDEILDDVDDNTTVLSDADETNVSDVVDTSIAAESGDES